MFLDGILVDTNQQVSFRPTSVYITMKILLKNSSIIVIIWGLLLVQCGKKDTSITPDTISTFDANDEGWTISGDATSTTPIFSTTGGNPGGYIYSVDRVSGDSWYFIAPSSFVNRAKDGYGKTLSFDLIQLISIDNQFDADDVILEGNGLKLTFNTPNNPALKWTNYSIKIDETAGWKKGNENATKADIQSVLQNLTKLQIRGEYRDGPDTEGLDNVMIK